MRRVLFTKERIDRIVQGLAEQINTFYGPDAPGEEPILVVGVLTGAVIFTADLVRRLGRRVDLDFVRASSYGGAKTSSGTVRLTAEPKYDPKGRRVLIVEDLIDTGRTLRFVVDYFHRRGAAGVEVAVLLDKTERREVSVPCRFVGSTVENAFLCGYGLDSRLYGAADPQIFAEEASFEEENSGDIR